MKQKFTDHINSLSRNKKHKRQISYNDFSASSPEIKSKKTYNTNSVVTKTLKFNQKENESPDYKQRYLDLLHEK